MTVKPMRDIYGLCPGRGEMRCVTNVLMRCGNATNFHPSLRGLVALWNLVNMSGLLSPVAGKSLRKNAVMK